jgi:hypothetical protein
MFKKLMVTTVFALWLMAVSAQIKTITGKVTSEDGSSLPGVSVIVKGKAVGTQTSESGTFSIEAAAGDILVFSFTGYGAQEIAVGQATEINLTLRQAGSNLSEVVVVGYGTQSRRNVTSAISKLDAQVLASAPRSNLGSAFQGTLPGLQVINASGRPGATPLLLLRGGASINNPGSPLVVVDGVIRGFEDIPPEDIASMKADNVLTACFCCSTLATCSIAIFPEFRMSRKR